MAHVCPWQHVWTFDNIFRPFIHNPAKMFSPHVPPGSRVLDVGCGAGFASPAHSASAGAFASPMLFSWYTKSPTPVHFLERFTSTWIRAGGFLWRSPYFT